jgi:hypothetical protein
MIRRDAMLIVGGYREEYNCAEDLDLWLWLAEIGKIANLREVVLRYRLHASSTSQSNRAEQLTSMERACASAWVRRGISGSFEVLDHWRPGSDQDSVYEFALRYGWTALRHENRRTWRFYAWKSLRQRPFSVASWKLLVFGFSGGRLD